MLNDQNLITLEQISGCKTLNKKQHEWIRDFITTPAGEIPVVSTELSRKDITGRWKARWGIGRMDYTIEPGLYAAGKPDSSSPVFVSANYKMSFDYLRKDLDKISGWILVLDTKGINVWCAAGKGTFGTDELVKRIALVRLGEIIKHQELIVPQLGAPGVAAHKVKKESGFNVNYGPVLSRDIAAYLLNDRKATEKMRRVPFAFKDRAALIPMELIPSLKLLPYIFFALVAVQLTRYGNFSAKDLVLLLPFTGAILMGTVLFQLLLPWIPFRSFIIKGWILGLLWSYVVVSVMTFENWQSAGWYFLLPPITSFLAENFTGATTFTHLSGVKLELKYGLPVILASIITGLILQFV